MSQDWLNAAQTVLSDKSLLGALSEAEAKPLLEWAAHALKNPTPEKIAQAKTAIQEISNLVGNKQELVADDLEERMVNLLVGDLDPKSKLRLTMSQEIAQVTAEKDHLENAELIHRLTQLTTRAWEQKQAASAAVTTPEKKSGFLGRLFGRS